MILEKKIGDVDRNLLYESVNQNGSFLSLFCSAGRKVGVVLTSVSPLTHAKPSSAD